MVFYGVGLGLRFGVGILEVYRVIESVERLGEVLVASFISSVILGLGWIFSSVGLFVCRWRRIFVARVCCEYGVG